MRLVSGAPHTDVDRAATDAEMDPQICENLCLETHIGALYGQMGERLSLAPTMCHNIYSCLQKVSAVQPNVTPFTILEIDKTASGRVALCSNDLDPPIGPPEECDAIPE
jgi:hypothetical protein